MVKRVVLRLATWFNSTYFRFRFCLSLCRAKSIKLHNSIINIDRTARVFGTIRGESCQIEIGKNVFVHKTSGISVIGQKMTFSQGVKIGKRCDLTGEVSIGCDTTLASDSILSGNVVIGSHCLLAPRIFISSGSHNIKGRRRIREQDLNVEEAEPGKVTIGDDCWIGVNSVIMPGVELGQGCVVGANAVVTKSFPSFSIIVGVPAKVIGYRE